MQKTEKTPSTKKPYEKPTLQKRERLDQVLEGLVVLVTTGLIP